ncbi:hypothetical protein SAMN05216466_11149 [Paraburkholderia phenazinium]|uniref:HNH endonuclease n=1 Tax=Paraburkholderia phenazinium TaxID=60549 RepID=A0A1G8DJS8_9BURK|nr:hypothetical protein [Paraburkholderia phenazinium]SDH57719.1 hypothetical protein SAMN05216466_11149 [Paraburkholderia phenazinium]
MHRSDFKKATVEDLARRVAHKCSNPGCSVITVGPQTGERGTAITGVAVHIAAASAGGPRYDAGMSIEERAASNNGIWLCGNCALLIDRDVAAYPVDKLVDWKRSAEARALVAINKPHFTGAESTVNAVPTGAQSAEDALARTETRSGQRDTNIQVDARTLISTQVMLQEQRRPAKLVGEGFSNEAQKQTTLSKYLELETWTPLLASLLVCGIQPQLDCVEMPDGAMGLDNQFIDGSWDRFHEVRRVLTIWNSREKRPEKVRPRDFVAWCQTKRINTDWLSEIEVSPRVYERNALTEKHIIEIASGSEFVLAANIPSWVAERLEPIKQAPAATGSVA